MRTSHEPRNRFRNLENLPPEPDAITLCELQGDIIHIQRDDDPQIDKYINAGGTAYPNIQISYVPKRGQSVPVFATKGAKSNDERSATKGSENTVSKGAWTFWHSVYDWIHFGIYLTGLESSIPRGVVRHFTSTESHTGAVRALSWHPKLRRFAVALSNDHVYFYDMQLRAWSATSLAHPHQRGITRIEWAPNGSALLAVACESGTCVWSLLGRGPSRATASGSFEWSSAVLTILSDSSQGPVTALSWSPDARLLASGSIYDSRILVWDITTAVSAALQRFGGTAMLHWSPDGAYLFAAGTNGVFRIWETNTWTCDKWEIEAPVCAAACWSPNSKWLLLAELGQQGFHIFHVGDRAPPAIGGYFLRTEDLRAFVAQTNTEQRVCGAVQGIAWDPTGERVAVSFVNSDMVALFNTRLQPSLELTPGALIRPALAGGQPPNTIVFGTQFSRGALLTAVYPNGKVAFLPLLFAVTPVSALPTTVF